MRGPMRTQQLLDSGKDIAGAALANLAALDVDLVTLRPQAHVRPGSHERVAADLFAALDRLEQKGIGLLRRHRQKGGHRREQVGGYGLDDRHQGRLPRQARELLKVRLQHDSLPAPKGEHFGFPESIGIIGDEAENHALWGSNNLVTEACKPWKHSTTQ